MEPPSVGVRVQRGEEPVTSSHAASFSLQCCKMAVCYSQFGGIFCSRPSHFSLLKHTQYILSICITDIRLCFLAIISLINLQKTACLALC